MKMDLVRELNHLNMHLEGTYSKVQQQCTAAVVQSNRSGRHELSVLFE